MPWNPTTKQFDLATKTCGVCSIRFKCHNNAQKYCVDCGVKKKAERVQKYLTEVRIYYANKKNEERKQTSI